MSSTAGGPDAPDDGYVGRHYEGPVPPAFSPDAGYDVTPSDGAAGGPVGGAAVGPVGGAAGGPSAGSAGADATPRDPYDNVPAHPRPPQGVPTFPAPTTARPPRRKKATSSWTGVLLLLLGGGFIFFQDNIADAPAEEEAPPWDDTWEGWEDTEDAPVPSFAGELDADGLLPVRSGDPVPLTDWSGSQIGTVVIDEVLRPLDCTEEYVSDAAFDHRVGVRLTVELEPALEGQDDLLPVSPFDFTARTGAGTPTDAVADYSCRPNEEMVTERLFDGKEGTAWVVLDVGTDADHLVWDMSWEDAVPDYRIDLPPSP